MRDRYSRGKVRVFRRQFLSLAAASAAITVPPTHLVARPTTITIGNGAISTPVSLDRSADFHFQDAVLAALREGAE